MYDFHTFCIIKLKDIVNINKMSLLCDICGYKSTTKYNLSKHQKTDSCQRIKLNNELNNKINNLTIINNELNNKILTLIKDLENKDNVLLNKDTEIKLLQDKCDEYRKIVEKAAMKTTKTYVDEMISNEAKTSTEQTENDSDNTIAEKVTVPLQEAIAQEVAVPLTS